MAVTEPQEMAFAETAPCRIDAAHECHAPASAVFEVLKDNPAAADWMGWYITSVQSTSTPGHGIGSTRRVTWLYGLGQLEERFIGWEEPALWSFTTTSFRPGIFAKYVERIRIEPTDAVHCRIVYRAALEFRSWARPLQRLVLAFVNRAIGPTLERLSDQAMSRHGARHLPGQAPAARDE